MQQCDLSMADACRRFVISRKTGVIDPLSRQSRGTSGLRDQLRALHAHPNQTSAEVERAILCVRKTYPTWGSKKTLANLERGHAGAWWSALRSVDYQRRIQPRTLGVPSDGGAQDG